MLQMQESARLFEVALPEYKQMKQCRKEIKLLKGLWDVIIYVRVRHCFLKECFFFFSSYFVEIRSFHHLYPLWGLFLEICEH